MKKKISVFALLLSLMLSFVVPVPAAAATETTADDVKYENIESFMHGQGYSDFDMKNECSYYVAQGSKFYYVLEIADVKNNNLYLLTGDSNLDYFTHIYICSDLEWKTYNVNAYKYYAPDYAEQYDNYNCLEIIDMIEGETNNLVFRGSVDYYGVTKIVPVIFYTALIYSDSPIYLGVRFEELGFNRNYDTLVYEGNLLEEYNFTKWCEDTGLNSFKLDPNLDYYQIVRKKNDGTYHLTTIGNYIIADNYTDYTLILSDDGHLQVQNLYSGDDENGYILCLSEYEYKSEQWDLRSLNYYDSLVDDDFIYDFGAGSGLDMYTSLMFNNVDIYSESFELIYSATAEHQQEPIVPNITPNPTPTTAPGNDSSGGGPPGSGSRPDTGGQSTGGGGLDFIINLFTLIWTKICSIPMAVDGYSINLQQIVIYGALVSIVGGFIMRFIFGRK